MKILVSSYYLDLSGTPTYTKTLYDELVSRGHGVAVYSPQGGELAASMGAVKSLEGMPAPDVILAQQNVCAVDMREAFPDTPMIFSAHGVTPDMEKPPHCDVQAYTAINEDVRDNLARYGVEAGKVCIVRDFVNIHQFSPHLPLDDSPGRVLFLSNFKKWRTYRVVSEACERAGVSLRAVGAPYGRERNVADLMNLHDLVITSGRGVIEAMACGRPVISFNQGRGDGYVTPEVYAESRTRNFAGDQCRYSFDATGLAEQIGRYRRGDGEILRGLAVENHSHVAGVNKLMGIVRRMARE